MNSLIQSAVIICFCIFLVSCESKNEDNFLFEKFQNSEAAARPMVRWWWNGNCVESDGPIMDHYKTDAILAYLNRLKVIEKETGLSYSELIRALFFDSIELGGSNWTYDMKEQFIARNDYYISLWLPFVIQLAGQVNKFENFDISTFMKEGSSKIGINLTTTLANYCRSLKDNPTAQSWTRSSIMPFSSGVGRCYFCRIA